MNKSYNTASVNKGARLSAALTARVNLDNIKAFELHDTDFCPFPAYEIQEYKSTTDGNAHSKNGSINSLTRSSTPNSLISNAFSRTPEKQIASMLASNNNSNSVNNTSGVMYYSSNNSNQKFPKVHNTKLYSPQRTFNNNNNIGANINVFSDEHYKLDLNLHIQGGYYFNRSNTSNNGSILVNLNNSSHSSAVSAINNSINYQQQFNNYGSVSNRNKYSANPTSMINNRPRSKVYGYSK